jgi:AcrR family transcriptional regulator
MTNTDKQSKTYHHGDLRNALLAAGEQELIEKGVEKFSLRGVAKRAEVSHAAPAHHFGDINGLINALATLSFQRFRKALSDRAAAENGGAEAKLVAIGLAYIDYANNNDAMFDLQFSSSRTDSCHPDLQHAYSASYKVLEDHVSAVLALTDRKLDDEKDAAPTAWALVHGLADLFGRRSSNGGPKRQDLNDAIERILWKNIKTL